MLLNPGAETATTEGWSGLEALARGEYGVRRGNAHSGEYAFYWRGQSGSIQSDWIAIDTNKPYEISGWFKAGDTEFNGLTFGLFMADKHQRQIAPINVHSLKNTTTELATDCRSGDRILYLKDAGAWQTGALLAAAFGVKENQLTFDATPPGIKSVRQTGELWEIGLANPCGLNMPTGTAVVENRGGNSGIFFADAIQTSVSSEWTQLKGHVLPKLWWHGTAYVCITIRGKGFTQGRGAVELWMDDFNLKVAE